MRHRRCISAILMSFVLFLQPVYAVPPEENQPENSQENNTENEVYFDEFLDKLNEAKKKLSSRQLVIFELSREKGCSIKDIAEKMGVSEKTVKNQLTLALKTLKSELSLLHYLLLVLLLLRNEF